MLFTLFFASALSWRALDKDDQKLVRLMAKRVEAALRGQRDKGVVRISAEVGQYKLWNLHHRWQPRA